jgi:hypothetical protein
MSIAVVKQGDTARVWTDTLTIDDEPIDLTGAVVKLRIRAYEPSGPFGTLGGTPTGDATEEDATVTDALAGEVSYQPNDGDVAVAGFFALEWAITIAGAHLTVPSNGYIILQVVGDLVPDT